MNTTRNDIDTLNVLITVTIESTDYKEAVEQKLKDYKKQATLPGFRKGHIPMDLLRKKHGKSLIAEEVNQLLQKELVRYIQEEKLNILGNPVPREHPDFSWDKEDFSFDFEIGLSPDIKVDLKKIKSLNEYQVQVTDDLMDEEIANLQKRFGTVNAETKIVEDAKIKGVFENKEAGITKETTFELKHLTKKARKALLGKEKEAKVALEVKNIFEEDFRLTTALGKSLDEAKASNVVLQFTVKEISTTAPARIDDAFLEKLFGKEREVKDETDLRAKIKKDSEAQFTQQANQLLMKTTTDALIDQTYFDLPEAFLKKWIQTKEKEPMSDEKAEETFEKVERNIRRQLIEGCLIEKYEIKTDYEVLKNYTKGFVKQQIAQNRGETDPNEEEVEEITKHILKNEQEAQRIQSNLINEKLKELYKTEVPYKKQKINYKDFVEKMTSLYQ